MKVKVMGIKSITKKDGTPAKFVFFCREPLLKEKSNIEGLVTDSFFLGGNELDMLPAGLKPGVEANLCYEFDGFRSVLSSVELLTE